MRAVGVCLEKDCTKSFTCHSESSIYIMSKTSPTPPLPKKSSSKSKNIVLGEMEAVVSDLKQSTIAARVVFEEQGYDKGQGTTALHKSCELILTI